jgi:transcriptional regulator with XRE-family HTH domain
MPWTTDDGDPGDEVAGTGFTDSRGVDLRRTFGANFRAARQKAGLTQRDIEARTGIKQHYVSEIESGKQNPTLSTMNTLAASVGRAVHLLLRSSRIRIEKDTDQA